MWAGDASPLTASACWCCSQGSRGSAVTRPVCCGAPLPLFDQVGGCDCGRWVQWGQGGGGGRCKRVAALRCHLSGDSACTRHKTRTTNSVISVTVELHAHSTLELNACIDHLATQSQLTRDRRHHPFAWATSARHTPIAASTAKCTTTISMGSPPLPCMQRGRPHAPLTTCTWHAPPYHCTAAAKLLG